jgi:hypothetical protein
MPAPKQFKPGPESPRSYTTGFAPDHTKGRYAVVPPPKKRRAVDEEPVEIAVDDVTVVMEQGGAQGRSKYEARSLHAHIEPGLSIEIDETPEPQEVSEPARDEWKVFGEWQSEANLDGTSYHRRDSRLT